MYSFHVKGGCSLKIKECKFKIKSTNETTANISLVNRPRFGQVKDPLSIIDQSTLNIVYSKEPKSVTTFNLFTFFHVGLIQSEAK